MSIYFDPHSSAIARSVPIDRRSEEYADLFGQAPVIFAALSGPKHLLEVANSAFFEAVGCDRGRVGEPVGEVIPELVPQGVLDRLDEVYRTGVAYRARDGRLMLGEPGRQREGFFDFTYEPRWDEAGRIDGVVVIAVETTAYHDAHLLASQQRVLLEQIARDAPLAEILDGMATAIEELSPDMIVSVLLVDPDGQRLRHGTAPRLPDFYNEAIDGAPIDEGVGSCGTAAFRHEPVIVTDIATDPLWKDYRDLALRAGVAACWSTPIQDADGRLLGTFAMYHRTPKAPADRDVTLSVAFARIAALAIERHCAVEARHAAQEREKAVREDLAFLLEASTAITGETHYSESLQCLARLTVPALAPLCAVHVVERGRTHRIAVAASTREGEELLSSPALCDDVDAAVARVLASGAIETSHTGSACAQFGVTGYVCVPLATRGRTFGTLTLLATALPLDGHTIALAQELARRAASSADNAHQFTDRVRLAHDLQAGLMPPELPRIPGATLAASYHPAGEGLDVGGDFYDVFPLSGDRWAFMIGDVSGRGALAATTTGMVRHTARAAARLLNDPAAVVAAINDALTAGTADEDQFVSLVYGELRYSASHLALNLIRAGHVPPLVRRADGTVEELTQPGLLLGIRPDPGFCPFDIGLRPGDSLVLVTDGITEARSTDGEFFGEDRLADALVADRTTTPTAATLIESITAAVTTFAGDAALDDRAALVVTAT
ncbi:serine phosphatase RsbU (regulator of sigma subunit) [Streptomyces griseochromogenes]|uniref:Guanylate cyclase n=1 Tax=Streptomyces griseochromogenes TaxID=68214 RepID=A0A1B1AUW9_9ACTN|nr:SpoIIE family protein phosphatase [Streptomyces griseochromogenes]ANP50347.1 guanylate cyclase [Streptomyces griseochromogenes]MBP2047974.1 serine phosphatase RsbU (regulator of sigma subunit) [Streptomyces griseochromogenes]